MQFKVVEYSEDDVEYFVVTPTGDISLGRVTYNEHGSAGQRLAGEMVETMAEILGAEVEYFYGD